MEEECSRRVGGLVGREEEETLGGVEVRREQRAYGCIEEEG